MKFSIITCSYNNLEGVQDVTRSVREQGAGGREQGRRDGRQGAGSRGQGTGEGDQIPQFPNSPIPFEVEHLVIDGGSTDGTVAWLESEHPISSEDTRPLHSQFPNSPINYSLKWISEPDRGLYDALNKGLKMATGDVIGILHTDDVWEADTLKRVVWSMGQGAWSMGQGAGSGWRREATLECGSLLPPSGASGLPDGGLDFDQDHHSGPAGANSCPPKAEASFRTPGTPDGVYGDLLYVDADDITKVRRVWKAGSYDRKKWWNGWMPPHPALFVTRELAERVGEYRLDLGSAADYEWMLRAALVHDAKLIHLPETLVRMRVGGQSNVSTQARLKANAADRRAWEVNGLTPRPWTLWMKPLRKLPQWVIKP